MADTGSGPVVITDKKQQPISLHQVKAEGCTDHYLLVHSAAKQLKEAVMNSRFAQRVEEGCSK